MDCSGQQQARGEREQDGDRMGKQQAGQPIDQHLTQGDDQPDHGQIAQDGAWRQPALRVTVCLRTPRGGSRVG